ncbi:MAG: pyridoxal-phosphate dependent enzyme [candidate division KSB1 bacterium]|nr:pyridoxal-phosphate dependent enzyme [candidate division KSB1 bacterium]MDZ7318811.1 pyridoxal-phosphate dependent enzyme [candidate division KSB1 bacterium]MDZ7340490.1 pyridoxal-phosphate dependent enzyme [candidate division KSB1 bacterium]
MTSIEPTLDDIRSAHQRIKPFIHRTPVLTCTTLDKMIGGRLFFKCENFQKVGAFKIRGASNAILSLSESESIHGVVTHSSGNHAAALALAARNKGIPAYIVMPSNAPAVKIAAVKNYGGRITFCEPTLVARETTAAAILAETGATLIHPFNDYRIIAGQGTAALELLEEVSDLEVLLAPVGGGGLLSGTAIAAKAMASGIKVIGCEPKNADDAYRSVQVGHIIPPVHPVTIADGLRTSLGDKTFPIIQKYVDEIALATEEEIVAAMRHIFERMKIIVEPSSAVPLAALLSRKTLVAGKKVGIIISGGNVDFTQFFEQLLPKSPAAVARS